MKAKPLKTSNRLNNLFDEFSRRFQKKYLFCFQSHRYDRNKLECIHRFCEKHGFILSHSSITMIQTFLANMITSAFNYDIGNKDSNDNMADIQLQLTHVNALPSRNEQGIFIIIELGNLTEDVRYNLVSLLGKHIPPYEILHSRGYNLAEEIRKSNGTVLIDQLAIGLNEFLQQVIQ